MNCNVLTWYKNVRFNEYVISVDYQISTEIRWKYDTNRWPLSTWKIHVRNAIKTNQWQKHGEITLTCWEKICSFDILGWFLVCVLFFIFSSLSRIHLPNRHILLLDVSSHTEAKWEWEVKTCGRNENTKWCHFFLSWNCVNLCQISVLCCKWVDGIQVSSPWRLIYG